MDFTRRSLICSGCLATIASAGCLGLSEGDSTTVGDGNDSDSDGSQKTTSETNQSNKVSVQCSQGTPPEDVELRQLLKTASDGWEYAGKGSFTVSPDNAVEIESANIQGASGNVTVNAIRFETPEEAQGLFLSGAASGNIAIVEAGRESDASFSEEEIKTLYTSFSCFSEDDLNGLEIEDDVADETVIDATEYTIEKDSQSATVTAQITGEFNSVFSVALQKNGETVGVPQPVSSDDATDGEVAVEFNLINFEGGEYEVVYGSGKEEPIRTDTITIETAKTTIETTEYTIEAESYTATVKITMTGEFNMTFKVGLRKDGEIQGVPQIILANSASNGEVTTKIVLSSYEGGEYNVVYGYEQDTPIRTDTITLQKPD